MGEEGAVEQNGFHRTQQHSIILHSSHCCIPGFFRASGRVSQEKAREVSQSEEVCKEDTPGLP